MGSSRRALAPQLYVKSASDELLRLRDASPEPIAADPGFVVAPGSDQEGPGRLRAFDTARCQGAELQLEGSPGVVRP